jgi:hypothetical protein
MDNSELYLVFVSGSQVEDQMIETYKKVYQHWESVWSDTFREIEGKRQFFSDHFTRQDEVMALFYKEDCIAVCCHRLANMALPSFKKDSYFQAWPEEAIAKLRRDGDKVVIDNQISVDPGFRKLHANIKFIELMSYLSFRHLSTLAASSITAAARNMRSMDSLFEKFGPEHLAKDVIFHGEATSLYALYPSQMTFHNVSPASRELGDHLLASAVRSRMINPFFSIHTGVSHAKKSA